MPVAIEEKDMPKWGWKKSLMYELIKCDETTQNRPHIIEYDYYAENQTCGKCKSNEFMWVMVPPHDYNGGVLGCCWRCRQTWIMPKTSASNRRDLDVTIEKAYKMCMRTKQHIPRVLREQFKGRQVELARGKRTGRERPKKIGE